MPTDSDRRAVLKEHQRRRLLRGGLGLYTYPQIRNTTTFQLIAGIVVGTIVASLGAAILWNATLTRRQEITEYGSAYSHFGEFALAGALILIGIFWVHPGIIFYWRKLRTPRAHSTPTRN